MIHLENKKVSIKLILVSLATLLIAFLIKEPVDEGLMIFYQQNNISAPLSTYSVYLLGFSISFKSIVICTLLLMTLGIYTLLYKSDEEIKDITKALQGKASTYATTIAKNKKSLNIMIPIILVVIGLIVAAYYGITYYNSIQTLKRPKTWGESLFIGIANTFAILVVIGIITKIFKGLILRKKKKK